MAITTYAELQTAVANWLPGDDLTSRITEFISLAEAKLGRLIRNMSLSVRAQASTTATGFIALPTGFIAMRSIADITSDPKTELVFKTPTQMKATDVYNQQGAPKIYTIEDGQFLLRPYGTGYTVELIYEARLTALSDSATSNWLLTGDPDIYLNATKAEAHRFRMQYQDAAVMDALVRQGLLELTALDVDKRYGGAALSVSSDSIEGVSIR